VAISNIAFRDINGTSTAEVVVKLHCNANVPCRDLTFDDIAFTRAGTNLTVLASSQYYVCGPDSKSMRGWQGGGSPL
jgi:Glycosyl hydrolases family 28